LLFKLISKEGRHRTWGPVLDDMSEIVTRKSLQQVCALQWQACVCEADAAFNEMNPNRIFRISYEDLVREKAKHVARLADFLDTDATRIVGSESFSRIRDSSVGLGYSQLGDIAVRDIEDLVAPTLQRFGYC
jgi:hypothetical protein